MKEIVRWFRERRVMKLQILIAGHGAKIEVLIKHLSNPTGYYDFEVRRLADWREEKSAFEMELKLLREKL